MDSFGGVLEDGIRTRVGGSRMEVIASRMVEVRPTTPLPLVGVEQHSYSIGYLYPAIPSVVELRVPLGLGLLGC